MDKKSLSERDICTKFICPAIEQAGWDVQKQVLEEFGFTAGRVMVRGKLHSRGERKRVDYLLSHQKNLPLAVIEAKDNKHSIGAGMQQALGYAEALDVNGKGCKARHARRSKRPIMIMGQVVFRATIKPTPSTAPLRQ